MSKTAVKRLLAGGIGLALAGSILYGATRVMPLNAALETTASSQAFSLKAQRSLLVCGSRWQQTLVGVSGSEKASYQDLSQESRRSLGTGIHELTGQGIVEVPSQSSQTDKEPAPLGFALGESYDLASGSREKCLRPENEFYFLSASTKVGATTVLKLINPGEKALSVELNAWSESGQKLQKNTQLVAAKSASEILLEGLYPGHEHLALKVKAGGSGVVAFLQHDLMAGTTSLGTLSVPGVSQLGQAYLLAPELFGINAETWKAQHPQLRLLNPNAQDLKVQLYQGGKAILQPLTVRANSIFVLPLQELANPENGFEIVAEGKILASLLLTSSEKHQLYQAIPALSSGSFISGDFNQVQAFYSAASSQLETGETAGKTKTTPGGTGAEKLELELKSLSEKTTQTQTLYPVNSESGAKNGKLTSKGSNQLQLTPGIWQWQSDQPIYLYTRRNGFLQDLDSDLLPSEISQVKIQVENY